MVCAIVKFLIYFVHKAVGEGKIDIPNFQLNLLSIGFDVDPLKPNLKTDMKFEKIVTN